MLEDPSAQKAAKVAVASTMLEHWLLCKLVGTDVGDEMSCPAQVLGTAVVHT